MSTIALTRAVMLQRARGAVGKGVYKLGMGGMRPDKDTPLNSEGQCDCSGFTSWASGVSRHQPLNVFYKALNGGWLETTAMVGLRPGGLFEKVTVPEPGDLICWGDRKIKGADGKLRNTQGHVGVITEVTAGKATKVVHCSSGNFKRAGYAIAETSADIFHKNGAIYLRRVA
jgi:hypothetical protein